MQMLALENYGTVEMNSTEMVVVDGGDLIGMAWDATPANGTGSFTNAGGGNWAGGAFTGNNQHANAVLFNINTGVTLEYNIW